MYATIVIATLAALGVIMYRTARNRRRKIAPMSLAERNERDRLNCMAWFRACATSGSAARRVAANHAANAE